MTYYRQLTLTYSDGRRAVVQTERDDRRGRATIEAAAFEAIERDDVASGRVTITDRFANTNGRGSYR